MTPYRSVTQPVPGGFIYRILEGDREVTRPGTFLLEADAASVGKHFASDPDLEVYHLKR